MSYSGYLYFLMLLIYKTIWLDYILFKTTMVLVRVGCRPPARRCQRLAEKRAKGCFAHAYNKLDRPMIRRSPYMGWWHTIPHTFPSTWKKLSHNFFKWIKNIWKYSKIMHYVHINNVRIHLRCISKVHYLM